MHEIRLPDNGANDRETATNASCPESTPKAPAPSHSSSPLLYPPTPAG